MEPRDVPSDFGKVLERFHGDGKAAGFQPGAHRLERAGALPRLGIMQEQNALAAVGRHQTGRSG
jgi:hypothetical protein